MITFNQMKEWLEKKNLLITTVKTGESLEINGLRTMRVEDDYRRKLAIVYPRREIFIDSVSFLAQRNYYTESQYRELLTRSRSELPFQLFIVNDLKAAEQAVRDLFAEEKAKPEPYTYKVSTLEEINNVPENAWIKVYGIDGNCPFCGKSLPRFYDLGIEFTDCDCECGQAAAEHNRRAAELN